VGVLRHLLIEWLVDTEFSVGMSVLIFLLVEAGLGFRGQPARKFWVIKTLNFQFFKLSYAVVPVCVQMFDNQVAVGNQISILKRKLAIRI